MKKLGFVIPWFGEKIPGGAEMALRELAWHLSDAGVELEILTTCVKEFTADWSKNYYPQGVEVIHNVPVRRFPVRKRDTLAFDQVNAKLMNQIPLTPEEEETFVREMVNSPALYEYMTEHKEEYGLYLFTPYMFGTTYYGVQICPEKTVMIPCFHDESYAYLKLFREAFSRVAGMIFLAQPECDLAHKLYGLEQTKTAVLGTGVDISMVGNEEAFREKYKIQEPFLLYAGRKERGKNVHTLVKYFAEYKRRNPNPMKLVLIGGGQIEIPPEAKEDILDLGFLPVQDKYDAYAAATMFCNPSHGESFSIVIMESWLAHRPVLVYGGCAVTKDFSIVTNGGLHFDNYFEFEGCLNYVLEHPEEANQMGENGRNYVLEHFGWDVLVQKYVDFLREIAD